MAQEPGGLLLVGDVDACEGQERVDEDDVGLMFADEGSQGFGEGGPGADGVAEDGHALLDVGPFVAVEVGAGHHVLQGFAHVPFVVLGLEDDGPQGLGGLDAEEVPA